MTIETLVIALVFLVVGWAIVKYLIPAPFKIVGWVILAGIAVIWLVHNIHPLLHCCRG